MTLPDPFRRRLVQLLAAAPLPLASACATKPCSSQGPASAVARLSAIEGSSGGRLGVAALDTSSGTRLHYHGHDPFPLCSTFKVMAAGAVLKRSETEAAGWLQQRVAYTDRDLVAHSPVTQPEAGRGMPLDELCAAALQQSDNTAANLLVRLLGGPQAVTAFARSMGDTAFRLDRWETELNSALPGDLRDTTTPVAMVDSLQRQALGDALAAPQRGRLVDWLKGSRTGAARIRAGVPGDWEVGDKTGTGDFGTTNDVAVLWPPGRAPIVLAVYFTQNVPDAAPRDKIIARAASEVAETFVP